MKGNDQVSGYFDIEKPKFALIRGPAWLMIDEATGALSGTPDAKGKVQVTVAATIDRQVRKLDEKALKALNARVEKYQASAKITGTPTFVINGKKAGGEDGGEQSMAELDAAIAAAEAAAK